MRFQLFYYYYVIYHLIEVSKVFYFGEYCLISNKLIRQTKHQILHLYQYV